MEIISVVPTWTHSYISYVPQGREHNVVITSNAKYMYFSDMFRTWFNDHGAHCEADFRQTPSITLRRAFLTAWPTSIEFFFYQSSE